MAKQKVQRKGKPGAPRRQAGRGAPVALFDEGPVFGPVFFQRVLRGMIRACPCGQGQEPACTVYLGDGQAIDVIQVVAIAERFVVLAVFEGAGEDGVERSADDVGIEAVPYDLILRVSVKRAASRARLGFHVETQELTEAVAVANGKATES